MVAPLTADEKGVVGGHAATLKMHPDGKPWDKCCRGVDDCDQNCQCLTRKPRRDASRVDRLLKMMPDHPLGRMLKDSARFFCCHRTTEDGYHRECAGWAAKKRKP